MAISVSIKVIVPKKNFKDKKWVESVEWAMKTQTAPDLLHAFRKTINGWEPINGSLPHFQEKIISNSRRIATEVTVFGSSKASRVYRMVTLGVPRHDIPAKKGGLLRFRRGYISATVPGSIYSGRAYRVGDWWTARKVDHPGFEARKFDELIAKDYEPTFIRDMQTAFEKAAKG